MTTPAVAREYIFQSQKRSHADAAAQLAMNIPPGLPGGSLTLRTPPFAHYGIAWSPFHPQVFALASSANYGLIGNGRVHIARVLAGAGIPPPIIPASSGVSAAGLQLDRM